MRTRTQTGIVLLSALCVFAFVLAGQASAQAKWTFMVFLNADNNLDGAGLKDVSEMEKAGSSPSVNIVVQIDRWHGPAQRLYIERGSHKVVEELGEVNMGDWRNLVDFVKWSVDRYPAEHYALVVWNHGSGWQKHRVDRDGRGISYDDTNNAHINTPQLGAALAEIHGAIGRKVDMLGFDACLMNMFEVDYELRQHCDYIAGSEETEPGDGWPYDSICGALVRKPSMGAARLASVVVSSYKDSYGFQKTTQSAVKLSALDELRKRTDAFVDACLADEAGARSAIGAALDDVQRFYYKSYIDFFHFMKLVASEGSGSVAAAARNVRAMEKDVVTANGVTGLPFLKMKAHGLSIYFPSKFSYYSSYEELAFGKESRWSKFLRWYLGLEESGRTPGDARQLLLMH